MWTKKRDKPVEFILQVNQRPQKVQVVPKKKRGGFVVDINEKRFEVDLCTYTNLESFIVSVDGCPYDVSREKLNSANKMIIDDQTFDFNFGRERMSQIVQLPTIPVKETPKTTPEAKIAEPGRTITAPMPGVVLSVCVQLDQEVHKGDLLLIFEAMKMENRIESPRDGVVKEILVQGKNDRINRGDPLFVVE